MWLGTVTEGFPEEATLSWLLGMSRSLTGKIEGKNIPDGGTAFKSAGW